MAVGSAPFSFARRYTSPDFLYIRSWLPCIFFSGGVTVGNIGRQLAMVRELVCHIGTCHYSFSAPEDCFMEHFLCVDKCLLETQQLLRKAYIKKKKKCPASSLLSYKGADTWEYSTVLGHRVPDFLQPSVCSHTQRPL